MKVERSEGADAAVHSKEEAILAAREKEQKEAAQLQKFASEQQDMQADEAYERARIGKKFRVKRCGMLEERDALGNEIVDAEAERQAEKQRKKLQRKQISDAQKMKRDSVRKQWVNGVKKVRVVSPSAGKRKSTVEYCVHMEYTGAEGNWQWESASVIRQSALLVVFLESTSKVYITDVTGSDLLDHPMKDCDKLVCG